VVVSVVVTIAIVPVAVVPVPIVSVIIVPVSRGKVDLLDLSGGLYGRSHDGGCKAKENPSGEFGELHGE